MTGGYLELTAADVAHLGELDARRGRAARAGKWAEVRAVAARAVVYCAGRVDGTLSRDRDTAYPGFCSLFPRLWFEAQMLVLAARAGVLPDPLRRRRKR